MRTLKKFTLLFDEKDATRLPLFKMELILDDDDNIQFYPMLEDLEDSILSVVNSITGTLQNVQSVQVIIFSVSLCTLRLQIIYLSIGSKQGKLNYS